MAPFFIGKALDLINDNHYHLVYYLRGSVMQVQAEQKIKSSTLFDPDLPTAKEVMSAICCVATQYALNPSLDLAKLASILANKLTAPEYAESKLIVEVAKRLVFQWDEVLREHNCIQTQVMTAHSRLQ
jgi:hypothetical protein